MSLSLYILPFVATDLTSQAKMVSGFFDFVTTFCIGFTQREKKYVKVIDMTSAVGEYNLKQI